jgi:hypothetical protein
LETLKLWEDIETETEEEIVVLDEWLRVCDAAPVIEEDDVRVGVETVFDDEMECV